ncbi:MAG: polyketide synthase, partial [Deltaproteobacteria bacterium]|nr:polyketide synthase [Deltaproteobacteria bacterium]
MKAVAIVGMGCRFAGSPDLHSYWKMTLEGRDGFSPVPPDRWSAEVFYDANRRATDKTFTPRGAFIDDIRSFPALALGLPPRRVEVMDPQQRLCLEVCLQAIDDAGSTPRSLPHKTGVFMGLTAYEYKSVMSSRVTAMLMASGHFGQAPEDPQSFAAAVERVVPSRPFTAPGGLGNMSAATVAQELDLHGPAFTVDAACASALVAVVDAVNQLRAGLIDAALAGGAYISLTPDHYIAFSRIGAMSAQGECLPFDAKADGFLQGEGGGAILLKRLEDAERDGDRVYAVIHGSAFNNDGKGEGPMAPVPTGQAEVLRMAWDASGVDPARMGYLETHGTGTEVGDVSEFQSLMDALGDQVRSTALGSSKANIGHTMSAAGIAGIIRAAMAIHTRQIPPMANFQSSKPDLGIETSPFHVPTSVEPWQSDDRIAGVSSFGFGGTNAHVVIGSPP